MTLFKTIRKSLALSLYDPNQTRIFDKWRVMVGCAAVLSIASFFTFLFFEANSLDEHVMSAYFAIALSGLFCSFIHTSTKTATMFAIIDWDIGEMVKKSEFLSPPVLIFNGISA